jgi:DNA-binding CsgD family transcriptional regulator
MILTREEKEWLVLDLYNQGKSTREIAEEARMSFRDIGAILNKAVEEKEASKEQAEKVIKSTQDYKLFSEGKSPVQVAITLNIREPEVARFYVEYWKLRQLYSLNKSYEELKDDIGPFVNLYTLAKVARMDTEYQDLLIQISILAPGIALVRTPLKLKLCRNETAKDQR